MRLKGHRQMNAGASTANAANRQIRGALQLALAKIEAAQNAGDLWEATRNLLRLALPFEFCCLNYYPFLATARMLFRERYPFVSVQQFRRFCEVAPFTPYLQANAGLKAKRHFKVPLDIVQSCRTLKGIGYQGERHPLQLSNANKLVVQHQSLPGLRATVNLLQMDAAPLSLPMFLIRLENREDRLRGGQDDRSDDRLVLWTGLSSSEQRVASLASQGYRNSEIAKQLNKSSLTVKKQLQSVYRKLDVPGRSRLIALLAATPSVERNPG